MKFKKQLILPIVAVTSLAAAVAPIAIVATRQNSTNNTNPQEETHKANEKLFEIDNGVLKGFKSTTTKAQIDEYVKDGKLYLPSCRVIGPYAFRGVDLPFGTEIKIAYDTQKLESYSFYGSTATKVDFYKEAGDESDHPLLYDIGNYAFASCHEITSFPFPKAMLGGEGRIGSFAFMDCIELRELDFQSDTEYEGMFTLEDLDAINTITIENGAFVGVLPIHPQESDYLTIKIGKITDPSGQLPDYDEYRARFMLSEFASNIQMQSSLRATVGEWIVAQTVVSSTETHNFDIASILPTSWMAISGTELVGIKKEYEQLLHIIPFNAIQIPAGIETINQGFWDALPDTIKENIRDLDMSSSDIINIPDSFMDDGEGGWHIYPQNICLSPNVTSIGDQAFFAGLGEKTHSKLQWINLNELTNLVKIGSDAFNGNESLFSFGKNPGNPDDEIEAAKEELILDFGRDTNLNLGAKAFTNTGIRNIKFNYSNKATSPDPKLKFAKFVFSGLTHLISISFSDDFKYNATYNESANQITFVDNDPVTQALELLLGSEGELETFTGSFGYEPSSQEPQNFVKIPQWQNPSSNGTLQEDYPDLDYFLMEKPKSIDEYPTLTGGYWTEAFESGLYLQGMMCSDAADFEFLDPERWNIISADTPQPVEYAFTYSEQTSSYISTVDADTPVSSEPFTFTCNFNQTGITVDRTATHITIEDSTGTPQEFTNYELLTDDVGSTATITIPRGSVTGNINATLTCKARTAVTPTADPTGDANITNFVSSSHQYIGEDISYDFNIEQRFEVDTDNSQVQVDGVDIGVGPNGYDIITDESSNLRKWSIVIHGIALKNATSVTIKLVSKAETKISVGWMRDNGALNVDPDSPTLKVGQTFDVITESSNWVDGFSLFVEGSFAICTTDSGQSIGNPIRFEAKAGDSYSMTSLAPIPAGTTIVRIYLGSTNSRFIPTLKTTGGTEAWIGTPVLPPYVSKGVAVPMLIQEECLASGYSYDLQQSYLEYTVEGSEDPVRVSFQKDAQCNKLFYTKGTLPTNVVSVSIVLAASIEKTIELTTTYTEAHFETGKIPTFPEKVSVGETVSVDFSNAKLKDGFETDIAKSRVQITTGTGTETLQFIKSKGTDDSWVTKDVIPDGATKANIVVVTQEIQTIPTEIRILPEAAFKEGQKPTVVEEPTLNKTISVSIPTSILNEGYDYDIKNCKAECLNENDELIETLAFAEDGDNVMTTKVAVLIPDTAKILITVAAAKSVSVTPVIDHTAFKDSTQEPQIPSIIHSGELVAINADTEWLKNEYAYDLANSKIELTTGKSEPTTIGFTYKEGQFVAKQSIPSDAISATITVATTTENINVSLTSVIDESIAEKISEDEDNPESFKKYKDGARLYYHTTNPEFMINWDTTMIKIGEVEMSINEWINQKELGYSKLVVEKSDFTEWYIQLDPAMLYDDITITIGLQ